MKLNTQKIFIVWASCLFLVLACAPKKPTPTISPSTESTGYAAEFPVDLNGDTFLYKESEGAAKEKMSLFNAAPNDFTETDWNVVLAVVKAADQEGRGQAYADRMAETHMARQFFNREREDITRRVNGAVSKGIKDANCNCEVETYGKVAYAFKDSVERKLDEHLLEPSDAYQMIERYEKQIGKKNKEALRALAWDIAFTAHVVYVLLPQTYQRLERRLAEIKDVKSTLQDAIESENAAAQEAGITKKEKKAREKKVEEFKVALASIDGYEAEAQKLVTRAETDIPAIQGQYEDAIDALIDDLEKRAGK